MSTFYPKIRVGFRKSVINLQRRLLTSWELTLNVKRERPFECIAFQGIFYLCLSIVIAISAHLDNPSVSFLWNIFFKIFYGLYCGEHVTIEKYIDGEFTKCINNTESVFCEREIGEKPEAFIHFRWEISGKNFRLLDSKEIGYLLCGLEIAVINLWVKERNTKNEFYFYLENLSTNAIDEFMSTHKCNRICRTLDLNKLMINLFRKDGEVGKVQKEKKTAALFSSAIYYHLYFTKRKNQKYMWVIKLASSDKFSFP